MIFPKTKSVALAVCCIYLSVCLAKAGQPGPDVVRFISSKSNAVYLASRDSDKTAPPEVWQMFTAASAGDWPSTSNLFDSIKTTFDSRTGHQLAPEIWFRVQEVGRFCGLMSSDNLKFIRLFADELFKTVPPGGIFLAGSDVGRFGVTALSRSHEEGKPFLTVSKSDLFDNRYLSYVRTLYRQQAKLPDENEANKATSEYSSDLMRRWQHDQQFPNERKQVLPNENVQVVNNQAQISGELPVKIITSLLIRDILSDNPGKECYIEADRLEEWIYPYLEPAGPIFKLRHAPADSLFEETLRDDREYWQRLTRRLIGVVVLDDWNMAEVCAAEENLSGQPNDFQGDADFLKDKRARLHFSNLRSADGALYAWHRMHAKRTEEQKRMDREAELAFRQGCLLCPRNIDAIQRYGMFLIILHRRDDMEKFMATAKKLLSRDEAVSIQRWAEWAESQY